MDKVIDKIDRFLKSKSRKIEIKLKDGFFIDLKKRSRNKENFLEIHTSGYDGTLSINEAVEFLQWTIYDYVANGII